MAARIGEKRTSKILEDIRQMVSMSEDIRRRTQNDEDFHFIEQLLRSAETNLRECESLTLVILATKV